MCLQAEYPFFLDSRRTHRHRLLDVEQQEQCSPNYRKNTGEGDLNMFDRLTGECRTISSSLHPLVDHVVQDDVVEHHPNIKCNDPLGRDDEINHGPLARGGTSPPSRCRTNEENCSSTYGYAPDELISPCFCTGPRMKYVHRGCLDQWRISGTRMGIPTAFTHCPYCTFEYRMDNLSPVVVLAGEEDHTRSSSLGGPEVDVPKDAQKIKPRENNSATKNSRKERLRNTIDQGLCGEFCAGFFVVQVLAFVLAFPGWGILVAYARHIHGTEISMEWGIFPRMMASWGVSWLLLFALIGLLGIVIGLVLCCSYCAYGLTTCCCRDLLLNFSNGGRGTGASLRHQHWAPSSTPDELFWSDDDFSSENDSDAEVPLASKRGLPRTTSAAKNRVHKLHFRAYTSEYIDMYRNESAIAAQQTAREYARAHAQASKINRTRTARGGHQQRRNDKSCSDVAHLCSQHSCLNCPCGASKSCCCCTSSSDIIYHHGASGSSYHAYHASYHTNHAWPVLMCMVWTQPNFTTSSGRWNQTSSNAFGNSGGTSCCCSCGSPTTSIICGGKGKGSCGGALDGGTHGRTNGCGEILVALAIFAAILATVGLVIATTLLIVTLVKVRRERRMIQGLKLLSMEWIVRDLGKAPEKAFLDQKLESTGLGKTRRIVLDQHVNYSKRDLLAAEEMIDTCPGQKISLMKECGPASARLEIQRDLKNFVGVEAWQLK